MVKIARRLIVVTLEVDGLEEPRFNPKQHRSKPEIPMMTFATQISWGLF